MVRPASAAESLIVPAKLLGILATLMPSSVPLMWMGAQHYQRRRSDFSTTGAITFPLTCWSCTKNPQRCSQHPGVQHQNSVLRRQQIGVRHQSWCTRKLSEGAPQCAHVNGYGGMIFPVLAFLHGPILARVKMAPPLGVHDASAEVCAATSVRSRAGSHPARPCFIKLPQ